MARKNLIAGLDVGTTKTAVVIGELYRQSQVHVVGIGTARSQGLKGGQVVDIALTAQAIGEAVFRAERAAGERVDRVCVGVAGGHLRSHTRRAEMYLRSGGNQVTPHHVNTVVRSAAAVSPFADREVVAVIPRTFTVDSMTGVSDPRGLAGRRLEVDAHVVTGAVNSISNLTRCVELARIEVESRILQPLASAEACLTPEQRRDGVVLVDIGGGTSDVAVFMDDACWHISVLAVGGALVTSDISRCLRLPSSVAEDLKIQNGRVDAKVLEDDSVIEVPGFDRGAPIGVRRCDLGEVVRARMEEVLEMIKEAIVLSGYYDLLPAGVVLTGGGSQLQGLTGLAAEVLELPVSLGRPPALWGLDEEVRQPEFSTGIGLVLAGLKARATQGWLESAPTGLPSAVVRMQEWARELLAPKPDWGTEY